jgi:formate dehydrogenase major subunit
LAATFGRGAMTNHWRDIKNADLILINGANPAEAHPVGFQWFMRAKLDPARGPGKGGGAQMIHADPRFSRTSAVSDMYVRIRTGTDVAYFGGLMNYVLQNNLQHADYVTHYTNASFIVTKDYSFNDGLFSSYDPKTRTYQNPKTHAGYGATSSPGVASWAYELDGDGFAKRDNSLKDPRCVFQLLKKHYSRYTPEMVQTITGIPKEDFLKIARLVGEMGRPDKVMTIVYAVGLTQHTTGSQLIRSAALLQLLLGNMGRPGGGMNAERGHANIQGNTDNAISWEILPGYLKIPQPGQKSIDEYVKASASKKLDPNSWNFFGTNYKKFMVSILKTWYGASATAANDFAFNWIPKPGGNSSWLTIYDQALKKKMEGVILSGMSATSIGPDSNQLMQALSNLKWLVVMDPFPTTSSEFWHGPGMTPASVQTEVFLVPSTHWIEKDGSFVNSGRWMQWKDAVLPPQGEARHDHWVLAELLYRVKALYAKEGGKFSDPIMHLTTDYADPRKPTLDELAREVNGKDLKTGKQMETFAKLRDDGTTTAGDWIYTGSYTPKGNLSKRRNGVQDPKKNDPTGMGFYPQWAWSWPLNRRVMYNRASADLNGKPWDPKRPGIAWNGSKWVGDVPDYPPKMSPTDPKAWLPFIMNGEGVGRIFSNTMADGPIPEHYEPVESPVQNALHPANSASPAAFLYDKAAKRENRFGTPDEYPIIATTYRLTEHEHYLTQQIPHLVQLQPEAFVEIPTGLAQEKGIKHGDMVRVHSKRGEMRVRAVVTNRVGQLTLGDKKVWQIGIPIHWGFVGVAADLQPEKSQYWLANVLTPFVGDANARTPETKAFLVQIDKMA